MNFQQIETSYLDLHKAKKLLEINKLLTQSLHLQDVLQNLITAASELVNITDTFIIYLYDENTGKLKFEEGKGVDVESLRKLSLDPGESITGQVFTKRRPSSLILSKKLMNL